MSGNFLSGSGYNAEDKYIKEQEAAQRTELDKVREAQKAKELKELHWMRCPKCGEQMEEKDKEGVKIDLCNGCGGIYFDKGEFELVAKRAEEHSAFDKISGFFHW